MKKQIPSDDELLRNPSAVYKIFMTMSVCGRKSAPKENTGEIYKKQNN